MKAIRVHHYGLPYRLNVEEAPVPKITDNEVLVKVYAAGVNHIDSVKASGIISHIYPLQFPWIPGADFSGKIEAVGKNITKFSRGDEVYGSKAEGGAYAECIAVSPNFISMKPRSLSFAEAAAVPMVAETAFQGLFNHGRLTPKQRVLIHGGAGAVGSYAVQWAHQAGAKVIVTASGKDKQYLLALGAHEVIDYHSINFETVVKNVDLVFDLVGGEVQDRSFGVLKEGGYLIATNQPPSTERAKNSRVNAIFMHAKPTTNTLKQFSELIDAGKLKVDIAKIYALKDAHQAWENMAVNLDKSKSLNVEIRHGKHVLEVPGNG